MMKLKRQLAEQWFAYILRCADGSLYTDITNDSERRVKQHDTTLARHHASHAADCQSRWNISKKRGPRVPADLPFHFELEMISSAFASVFTGRVTHVRRGCGE